MFAITFKRLYFVCDKVIIRNIRQRRLDPSLTPNPGLQNRIEAFRKDGLKMEDDDAEEFVEQSASDFRNVGKIYNEHLTETKKIKHDLRHHIVKEKYFKEKMPNLLTWSEKEQIRHLASTEPDEWTPEKIAESFPVTAPVVKRLLKYPWKPATEERIARHDASAMRNWRELKEGTLDIPEELRKHFLKFSERTIPPLPKESIKIDVTRETDMGEFEKIIQRCAAKDKKSKQEHQSSEQNSDDDFDSSEETALTLKNNKEVRRDYKRVTLDELTAKIQNRLDKGNAIDVSDKIILHTVNTKEPEPSTAELSEEIELHCEESSENKVTEYKAKENEVTKFNENKIQIMSGMNYPERIRIPKKAYKHGATYKVNDCYYDHDGRFLYRVIGMSNNNNI